MDEGRVMKSIVFFSWQSDRHRREGRSLIEKALQRAVERISRDISVEDAVRDLEVDTDTKGEPGSPPIFETILAKIDRTAVFVPDLTFVGTRASGQPTPNPNVLIEYGYALKTLTHSRILGVMNTAHGRPDDLPFDLRHRRHPITYELHDGASDEERRAARERLAGDLERAVRGVLGNEVVKSKLTMRPVEPPAFVFRDPHPHRGRARFRGPGEAIGVSRSPEALLKGEAATTVRLADGPAMWLRLAPVSSPGRIWKIAELETASNLLAHVPLCECGQYLSLVRGNDGVGIHSALKGEPSPTLVYAFTTGEVWAINAWALERAQGRIVLEENRFSKGLEALALFLKSLGMSGPYRWIAGMEELEGRYLDSGTKFHAYGPCMKNVIEKDGIYRPGDDATLSLRPFFDEIFDQCGTERPGSA
jgi:hypothetical protein